LKLSNAVIEEVVAKVAGADVVPLVHELKNKKNVSEFKLAEKMNLEVNQTRNMLYRLYQANMVSFLRRKDKKKGWYIYYWTFHPNSLKHLMSELRRKELSSLSDILKKEEEGNFYVCPNKCIRLSFDSVFDFGFKCPECGEIMITDNNSEKVDVMKKRIEKLEREIDSRSKIINA
jgi:transcription initiation factor TFIIE subunit alpha